MGILCVTIDLDEIDCYHRIHGLAAPAGLAAHAVYLRALPRLVRLLEEQKVRATLFAVGQDIEAGSEPGSLLRDLTGRGHEIGNHTMGHPYDLTLLDADAQAAEIDRGSQAIARVTGLPPRGFRAPGYNVNLGLLDLLSDRGYLYDSSVFPCPAYYSLKAAAMGVMTLRGRRSNAVMGDPRLLAAPTGPYRVGRDGAWSKGQGLCELPISVVTPARLPFIGTNITMMGRKAASLLARQAARLPFFNLELHGIDLADAQGDGLSGLVPHQIGLKDPLDKKRGAIESVIATLLDKGMEPMTLAEAAQRVFV
ncbi:MAG: polysaccharide deacetylase family protein [Deltaproteobacteria bacterium]|nr:polysaccharide deacetylase family protein [Deltaproteobacteria bacterium]